MLRPVKCSGKVTSLQLFLGMLLRMTFLRTVTLRCVIVPRVLTAPDRRGLRDGALTLTRCILRLVSKLMALPVMVAKRGL